MKNTPILTWWFLVALLAFSFGSCDEDADDPLHDLIDPSPDSITADSVGQDTTRIDTTLTDTTSNDTVIAPEIDSTYLVRLQNEVEHSGIMITIKELDVFTLTDPYGQFLFFEALPDGNYTLEAQYPYYEIVEIPVTVENQQLKDSLVLELKQLLQFEVIPSDTTLNFSSFTNDFPLLMKVRVSNLTGQAFDWGTPQGPSYLNALRPSVGNYTDHPSIYCHYNNGILTHLPTFDAHFGQIGPFQQFEVSVGKEFFLSCFLPGEYFFYSCVTVVAYYPKYFAHEYTVYGQDLRYKKMNLSLYLKKRLFKPARVILE